MNAVKKVKLSSAAEALRQGLGVFSHTVTRHCDFIGLLWEQHCLYMEAPLSQFVSGAWSPFMLYSFLFTTLKISPCAIVMHRHYLGLWSYYLPTLPVWLLQMSQKYLSLWFRGGGWEQGVCKSKILLCSRLWLQLRKICIRDFRHHTLANMRGYFKKVCRKFELNVSLILCKENWQSVHSFFIMGIFHELSEDLLYCWN